MIQNHLHNTTLDNIFHWKDGNQYITADLEIKDFTRVGKVIWIVAKHFACLQQFFFQVNFPESREKLQTISQESKSDNKSIELFNSALQKYKNFDKKCIMEKLDLINTNEENKEKLEKKKILSSDEYNRSISPFSVTAKQQVEKYDDFLQKNPDALAMNAKPTINTAEYHQQFCELAEHYNQMFPKKHNPRTEYGYLTKKIVPEGTKIAARADLHGDLPSLLANIKTLQEQGLLDAQYRCMKNVELVFFGDYEDRGCYSLQVLELLMLLRMENPDQVTLLRGNHENININCEFGAFDMWPFIKENQEKRLQLLNNLYDTMPLSLYIAEETNGTRQYVQFTHGLFELYVDPADWLDSDQSRMPVSQKPELSERIKKIEFEKEADYSTNAKINENDKNRKLKYAAQQIRNLFEEEKESFDFKEEIEFSAPTNRISNNFPCTTYNWGDLSDWYFPSTTRIAYNLGSLGNRQWYLNPEIIRCYLYLSCGNKSQVKFLLRGHQHKKQFAFDHVSEGGEFSKKSKHVATTMPVAMEIQMYQSSWDDQEDLFYVMTTASRVKDWKKTAYTRPYAKKGIMQTTTKHDPVLLLSDKI